MSVFHTNALAGASGRQGAGGAAQYQISRSLRLNTPDTAYLTRNVASDGNQTTWTWSGWVKRVSPSGSVNDIIFCSGATSLANFRFSFNNNDKLQIADERAGVTTQYRITTAVYRDFSSWMHIVLCLDQGQALAADRLKLYVNGSEVTAFDTNVSVPQSPSGQPFTCNTSGTFEIGRNKETPTAYFNGYLADIHFIDGQALTPSSFGETDATTGEWIPKAYTGTYGTNGFKLDFADNSAATAAALGKDTSPNGNNFTPTNLSVVDTYNWSGYFQGVHYISVADNTALQMGTGDFTVEFWINFTSLTGYQTVIDKGYSASGGLLLQSPLNSGNLNVYLGGTQIFTTTGTVNAGQWYHYALVRSGTAVTMYRGGSSVGTGTSSANLNSTDIFYIGGSPNGGGLYTSAYISNVRLVKGTAVYTSSFTPPIKKLSAIAGTSLLTCQSSTFVDNSPNGFAISNSSVSVNTLSPFASPVGNDSMVDSPTSYGTDAGVGGEVRGNYCTMNPLASQASVFTLTNGNLDISDNNAGAGPVALASIAVNSGKWYWEVTAGNSFAHVGAATVDSRSNVNFLGAASGQFIYNINNTSSSWINGSTYNYATASGATAGDIIGVALNFDANTITFYRNGVSQGVFGSNVLGSLSWAPAFKSNTATSATFNFGQRPFAYTAPSGFKALCDTNLPAPAIVKPSTVMDTVLYTGTGASLTPTSSLGFSPDLVWIKSRSSATNNALYDTVRGAQARLESNTTDAEVTTDNGLTAFNSNGFTLGTLAQVNTNTATYAAWCWDAGSSTVTNTAGTISSQVRANASAGFSIVTGQYFGGTLGHGLGVAPAMVIARQRTANSWYTYHKDVIAPSTVANNSYLLLQTTGAVANFGANYWNVTSSTISSNQGIGGNAVYYCFAPVAGYSAFGSYTGNGNVDGPFVYTGFRPRWLMIKQTTAASATNWVILDTARLGYNVDNNPLWANLSTAEGTTDLVDITSNGFKMRATDGSVNASAGTYVYAAFAESPFQTSRAR